MYFKVFMTHSCAKRFGQDEKGVFRDAQKVWMKEDGYGLFMP